MSVAFVLFGIVAIYLIFYTNKKVLALSMMLMLLSFFIPSTTVGQIQVNILCMIIVTLYAIYLLCVNYPINYTCIFITIFVYICLIKYNFTYSLVLDNYMVWLCFMVIGVVFSSKYVLSSLVYYSILSQVVTAYVGVKSMGFVSVFSAEQMIAGIYAFALVYGIRFCFELFYKKLTQGISIRKSIGKVVVNDYKNFEK